MAETEKKGSILIQFKSDADKRFKSIADSSENLEKKTGILSGSMGRLGGVFKTAATGVAVAGVGIASVLGVIGTASLNSAMAQETMGVALKTSFQGNAEEAKKAQSAITEFASKTPYQLNEAMTGFIKLKNMGLDPSQRALTAYGDTASAMGKSLNDMVEAVADAATGEFERLKEFGIRSSQEGDKVKFTFQGVTTTVSKNSKDIENYLIKLGETKFAGGMEAQSKTLSGTLSTLKDNFSLTMASIATESGLLDIAKTSVSKVSDGLGRIVPAIQAVKAAFKSDDSDVGQSILERVFPPRIASIVNNGIALFSQAKTVTEELIGVVFKGKSLLGDGLGLSGFIGPEQAQGVVGVLMQIKNGVSGFVNFVSASLPKVIPLVKQVFQDAIANYGPIITAVIKTVIGVFESFANLIIKNMPTIVRIFEVVRSVTKTVWEGISKLIANVVIPIFNQLSVWIAKIAQAFFDNWPKIEPIVKNMQTIISTLVEVIVNVFKFLWPVIKFAVDTIVAALVFLLPILLTVLGGIISFVVKTTSWFISLYSSIAGVFQNITGFFTVTIPRWWGILVGGVQNIVQSIKDKFNGVKDFIVDIFNGVVDRVKNIFTNITGIGGQMLEAVKSFLNEKLIRKFNNFRITIPLGFKDVVQDLPDLPMLEKGGSFVTNGPQAFVAGDGASRRERVTVEPLAGPYKADSKKEGVTVNMYNYAQTDPTVLAQRVVWNLKNLNYV